METKDIIKEFDLEYLFEVESLPYKKARGRSGMQINAKHCPACGDSRWRVYLNADSGVGNCFVCNKTYTKLSFIHEHLGHGDKEWGATFKACKDMLKDMGYRPRRTITAAVIDTPTVKLPYSFALPTDEGENLQYLEQRGIDASMGKYFHLRFCEYGFWQYVNEDGEKVMQRFDNRVIIPVYDIEGDLVTFQGRAITTDSEKKYLFPATLPGTGRYLFNGQNVLATSEAAMGEGAFDVVAMKMAFDDDNALRHVVPIGSFGKNLSYGTLDGNDQLGALVKLKARGLKRLTIMWDGEHKALMSALNAAKLVSGIGLQARIALLPLGKDPNEVLPEVVRRAYFEAVNWSPALDIKWRLRSPYPVKS
ncbi:DNA primase [Phyllobacterium myrsinacearum]|uniref:DNA primase n=1 Tax=Phyllobacterium myrsinacearum TaxID=28101 RepID=A0A839EZF5_9HYPH|nr:DNA primase [Phyllobacterium myrsinacearum]MBA8881757.1 DNA primase [Phyllobacterium myrsinacearum]